MKYLITGGAGFIGSHLAEELLKAGNEVTIIDDLSTGSISNIIHIENHHCFKKVIDTVMNEKLMEKLIKSSDFVYHLAAAVGVEYIINNALHSLLTNSKGTEIVLKLCNKFNNVPVLITSTSEIYGKNENIPFKETDDRVLGSTHISRWGYSCSKAFDEFLALAYCRERRLPVIIARLFNTCGERQTGRYGMVIPRFVQQALRGKPVSVYGSGKQTRSFTSVKDVIRAFRLLEKKKKCYGQIFNIGNNKPISIEDLAEKIIELTQSRSKLKYIPYNKAFASGFEDMQHRVPDISKIEKFTGWKPKIKLETIINSVIKEKQNEPEFKL